MARLLLLLGIFLIARTSMKARIAVALISTLAFAGAGHATTLLYTQNFENPSIAAFNAGLGPDASFTSVNTIYNNQPTGFSFAQQYTVETLRVGGNQAWGGSGFADPQNIAGSYVISMLSSAQNDLLGLSFDIGTYDYLNFQLDISSIDLNFWGGPFVPTGGIAPQFRISLYDNPTGAVGLNGNGTLLSQVDITGALSASKNTFNWTNHIVGLSAAGNTNGKVTLQIDELVGGYAALDNFRIAASDTQGDVGGTVPEPATLGLLGLGLVGIGFAHRRKR
jgi:hypothetical protein